MERRARDRDSKQEARMFFLAQPLFAGVRTRSPAFLSFLKEVELRVFDKAEAIYRTGAASANLYLVRDGEVRIVRPDAASGEARLIGVHGRGSLFGEVSLLTGEPHSADAVAALDSSVFVIPGDAFRTLLKAEPALGSALTGILSQRLQRSLTNGHSAHPARIHVLFYPEDPLRGSEIAAGLGEALASENPGPVLILSSNPASILGDERLKPLSRILERWPDISGEDLRAFTNPGERGYDVLIANEVYGMELNLDRIVRIMPDFLGRLRNYYATILVDAGGFAENPVLSRILSQCDHVVLVQNPASTPDSRGTRRFREVTAYCTELLEDFFERVITITDECEARGVRTSTAARFVAVNRNSALYRNHLRLPSISGDPAHTLRERGFLKTLHRLARTLSGTSRGLALGGGGARAFAHIGVIEVLEQEGIDFDAIAGTSMGAVIGAGYAMGHDAAQLTEMISWIIPNADAILEKRLPLVSFFSDRRLNRAILNAFGETRFEDLDVPFYCNGSDLNTAQSVIFENGYLSTAIRASVSLPGLFAPVHIGPHHLVDGGILNNLPGSILRDKGFTRLIGVNVSPIEDRQSAQTNVQARRGGLLQKVKDYLSLPPILKIIYRSTTIQGIELLKYQMQNFDYVFQPRIDEFDIFDFHRRDEIIEAGRRAARDAMGEVRDALARGKLS